MIGLAIALVIGTILRLIWPGDMEYKGDEIFSFQRTQLVGVSESWPWIGMNNSADVPHPGMSVWVFIGLAKLFDAHDPVALNVACMALNVAALFLLVGFVACVVPITEREPWWWAIALVAVNPIAVLFHRKIWPPSVLPLITVLLLIGWWYRGRKPWAVFWGFVSAIAAQIHPGAFFFSAGMALWALFFDRQSMRWLWAALGGLAGSLTALPWLYYLITTAERSAAAKARWTRLFELKFWNYWVTEPFGFNLQYSLGNDFTDFLRYPILFGWPTYLVAVLHLVLAVILFMVIGRQVMNWWHDRTWKIDRSPTAFTVGAVVVGYGLLLTITGLPVYRHYLIITFPLMFVWLARLALQSMSPQQARRILTALCCVQAVVTILFLTFIHQIDRPICGDYGAPYRVQLAAQSLTAKN